MDALAPAQSPFLSGTQIQFAWDSTSIGYLKTCPRLYQYTILEGWQAKEESVHLRFGGEYHTAIQDYEIAHAQGESFDDAVRIAIRALMIRIADWDPDPTTKAGNYKNQRTLLQLVVDYFDFYREDTAKTLILENGKPAVELTFKFELDWGPSQTYLDYNDFSEGSRATRKPIPNPQPYLLCGHLDRVVDFNGSFFVLDHKTTTTTPSTYWFNQFEPNNQMTLYSLAGRVVINSPVRGVIVEGAQIKLEEPNAFVRSFTYRTQDQLDEWIGDLAHWLSLAETYATTGHWPMNDTACDKFGGCRFREICSKSPQVRENFLRADFHKLAPEDRWNPLRNR